jgi:methionyl-tRNA formyltransferase
LTVKEVEINKDDKAPDIFRKFEEIGSELLLNTLSQILV